MDGSVLQVPRGSFDGGICIKEFLDLKRYGGKTNEYRVFYINHEIATICRNSGQGNYTAEPPKELLEKYSEAFKHCRHHFDEYWGSEALRAAYALDSLKHGINLLDDRLWEFSFDKAKDPDFFKTSGITVDAFRGCGYENVLLEDTRVLNI